jgi:hypothetical protein
MMFLFGNISLPPTIGFFICAASEPPAIATAANAVPKILTSFMMCGSFLFV